MTDAVLLWLVASFFNVSLNLLYSCGDIIIAGERFLAWHLRLYRVTPAVTRDLGFCGPIQRAAPFRRHVRQARDTEDFYSNLNPHALSTLSWFGNILLTFEQHSRVVIHYACFSKLSAQLNIYKCIDEKQNYVHIIILRILSVAWGFGVTIGPQIPPVRNLES